MAGDRLVDSFWNLWDTFVAIATDPATTNEIVCVFDAFDECSETDREALVQAINDLDFTTAERGHFKILLTSRPYNYMRRGFHELEKNMPVIHLSGESEDEAAQIRDEIGLVIEHWVRRIGSEKNLTSKKCDNLLKQVTSIENRTYLWVHIVIDILRKSPHFDDDTIEQTIKDIPQSLDAAYEKILRGCPDPIKARQILGLILGLILAV